MELILLENIINLGNIGDKVKVKNGYGRNFLLRFGKPILFNSTLSTIWEGLTSAFNFSLSKLVISFGFIVP